MTLCCVSCVALPATCADGAVRLIGGSTASEGLVQVCLANRWGRVCDDGWGQEDAAVVCRQLGYSAEGTLLRVVCCYMCVWCVATCVCVACRCMCVWRVATCVCGVSAVGGRYVAV